MTKYRKKPVVIDAVQWNGNNFCDVFQMADMPELGQELLSDDLLIPTLEGEMTARKGDYIIKGVKGEIYPCKPDIFESTYDLVEEFENDQTR